MIASYVFYGWWDWRFLILIAITSMCSFMSGISLSYFDKNGTIRSFVNVSNIILNLGFLSVFKYFNFFVDSFVALFDEFGYHIDYVTVEIILSVGISFYTFQALSYSIDVYRRKIVPTYDVIEFFGITCITTWNQLY